MGNKNRIQFSEKAQTAMELAVFGSIFVFILGAMIRASVNNSFTQNEYLRALRLAMQRSFESSTSSFDDNTGDMSRATASLAFIEDRTSPDANKYGSLTRNPYVVSVSASFSKNLFKTMDYGDKPDLPIEDMFINGQHFTFSIAGYRWYIVAQSNSQPNAAKYTDPLGTSVWVPIPPNSPFGPGVSDWSNGCGKLGAASADGGCRRFYVLVANGRTAVSSSEPSSTQPAFCSADPCQCAGGSCDTTCQNRKNNCEAGCPPAGDLYRATCLFGCQLGMAVCVQYNPNNDLTAAQRFDLNRDGIVDVTDPGLRSLFSWQWNTVYANTIEINLEVGDNTTVDVDGDLKEEHILEMIDNAGRIYKPDDEANGKRKAKIKAPIRAVKVLDFNQGDFDMSDPPGQADPPVGPGPLNPPPPRSGLKEEMIMYTYTREGTYLQIREGKLFNPESETTVRSWQKRDQVDVIERQIQLSTDTGRFCENDPGWEQNPVKRHTGRPSATNPAVEACNDCYSAANIYKTCFDETSLMLYVRSRIQDRRGRHWITDVSP